MDRSVRESGAYRFGLFRLDAARRALTRDGTAVVLTPTVFEALLYLVKNPSRVVTKEELLGAVWPGRFVEEFNLTQTISTLRKALRDAGDDGRVIVTAPGQGYRFAAEVQRIVETTPPVPGSVKPEPSPQPELEIDVAREAVDVADATTASRRLRVRLDRRSVLLGGGALAFTAAGSGGWVWWRDHSHGGRGKKSIVVLPFANLSGDPNQAYFSDGITEEVRDALAAIEGLRVIGRISSAQARDMSSQDIAAKLGVSAILTGSVRRSQTKIRVSAQLVDAARGDEIWSEDYDRAPGDVLEIEDGIAKGVKSALDARLGMNEAFAGTSDPQAHDLYLKAMALTWQSNDEVTARQALKLIDSALRIDPRYAKAYAARADCLNHIQANAANMADQLHFQAEAEQSARRAMALAPNWSLAHDRLAHLLRVRLDFRGALKQYMVAQRLDPSHVSPTFPYFLALIGRGDDAVAAQAVVVAQDPLNPITWKIQAQALYITRHYQKALALAHQTLAWAPKLLDLRSLSAFALLCLGRPRDALDQASALPDDSWYRALIPAIAHWQLGDRRSSDAAFSRLKHYGVTESYQFAQVHAQRSEIEAALESLQEAWRLRDAGLMEVRTDPFLDPLRNEPGFHALLAKLDIP
jgi:TolB-like protein/DNA-binding winged helix-turn-helix (wHTH) protein/tetratricopeptide (TPR) repeat protein